MDLLVEATIRVTVDDSFIDEWSGDDGGVQSLARDELAWRLLRGTDHLGIPTTPWSSSAARSKQSGFSFFETCTKLFRE